MKLLLVGLLLGGMLWASDGTVLVKSVEMEIGHAGATSYNYHAMIVDFDGATYKISRPFVRHETWLHKGEYSGRWADAKKRKLQVDVEENGHVKHVDFNVLAEE